MEDKKKKKKLTLTAFPKKPVNVPLYFQDRKKTSVIIEKKVPKSRNEKKFYNRNDNYKKPTPGSHLKSKGPAERGAPKASPNKNFEIRKIAEERATRRFKNLESEKFQPKKSGLSKSKNPFSKREYKLTISKALDEEGMDQRERSLASVRRSRLKEKKNQESQNQKIEVKKIIRDVNIPDKITIQ